MGNKQFAVFFILVLSAFLGWMVYDSREDSIEIQSRQAAGDALVGPADSVAAIQYLFHFPDPVYYHDHSTEQIEQLGGEGAESEHYHVYGITVAGYKMDALYQFNWNKKWFKEEYSMWVENLQVDFSYNTLNVYVTNHYNEDSCEYKETLAHENQHVEVHRRVYRDYQDRLRETLGRSTGIPMSDRPLLVSSVEEGKARISRIISGIVDPVFDSFKRSIAEEQARLDTSENYAELKSRCQNW